MPMWSGYWGPSWVGLGWIFPLIGLVFMVVMVFFCIRMMSGKSGFDCMARHGGQNAKETEDLRREVRELKDEIRKLREPA